MDRILDIVRWDLTNHRRAYMLQLATIYGLFLMLMLYPIMTGRHLDDDFRPYSEDQSFYIMALGLMASGCYLTQLSAPFHGKQNRLSMLMLPASMRQKLAARLITIVVMVPVGIIAAVIAADLSHLALAGAYTLVTGGAVHSYCPELIDLEIDIIKSILPNNIDSWYRFCKYIIGLQCLIGAPLYALVCGALWTRYALLKCIASMIGFGILFAVFSFVINHTVSMLIVIAFNAVMIYMGYHAFINRELSDRKLLQIKRSRS